MPTQTRSSRSRGPAKRTAATTSANGTNDKIKTYASALRWLRNHADPERMRIVRYNTTTFNLSRMKRLLKALGNPEANLKVVHVAGSKGKGSTCAMLASMLQASGYTVGLYSSPHLIDLRERIAINGQVITQTDLTQLMQRIQATVNRDLSSDEPSFFELMTAAAVMYFAEQAVDVAVLETGLGGRLDATNVMQPLVCGITEISYDHTAILGEDLPSIAREKAGIFKKGVPAITVRQTPEVAKTLVDAAEHVGAPLKFTGKDIEFSYRFEANRELGPHTRVCLTTERFHYEHLPVPLRGEHQALNCGLALALLDQLRQSGFDIAESKLVSGLAATNLPGRMEMAWSEPRILLDGAHNAASMEALIKSIGAHIPYDSLVMIFGCAADKDISGMLRQINLGADKVIFTRAKTNPRAMETQDLVRHFGEQSEKMAQTAETLPDALQLAARAVSREDLVCVTGSFYLVGEAKKYLAELTAKRTKAAAASN